MFLVLRTYNANITLSVQLPRETNHMPSLSLAWKLLQKFVTFVTFVEIEYGTFVTFSVVRY